MQASFETLLEQRLSVKVEDLYGGWALMQKKVRVDDEEIQQDLSRAARIRQSRRKTLRRKCAPPSPQRLNPLRALARADGLEQGGVHQRPAGQERKPVSSRRRRADGVGAGASWCKSARTRVVIQSPYLVVSDKAMELFRQITARGVTVRINTNSLASTDNLPAFSGYRNQRAELLKMGLRIYEYKPAPEVQLKLMQRSPAATERCRSLRCTPRPW